MSTFPSNGMLSTADSVPSAMSSSFISHSSTSTQSPPFTDTNANTARLHPATAVASALGSVQGGISRRYIRGRNYVGTPIGGPFKLSCDDDWQQLGGLRYRRLYLGDMKWGNAPLRSLEGSSLAVAPFGGPIAAVRSEKIFQPAGQQIKPELQIFTAMGRMTATVPWPFTRLLEMQWNDQEHVKRVLCCWLMEHPVPVLSEALVTCLSGCLMLNSLQKVADGPFVSLVVSRSGRFVACLSNTGALDILIVSSSGVTLAARSNFEYLRRVREVAWCADDCLGVYVQLPAPSGATQHVVYLGGPGGAWLPLDLGTISRLSGGASDGQNGVISPLPPGSNRYFLVSEVDGLRIGGPVATLFLHRVGAATDSALSVGSCEPSAMLCFAFEALQNGEGTAERNLRAATMNLGAAVRSCCEAALCEWSSERAAFLLAAASFGNSFCNKGDALPHKNMCKRKRPIFGYATDSAPVALSATANASLTHCENAVGWCSREEHLLAFRICCYAGIDPRGVLASWALRKIHVCVSLTDEELANTVCKRLEEAAASCAATGATRGRHRNFNELPFAKLALCAAQAGRPLLATKLAEREGVLQQQVALLLKLNKIPLAIQKAAAADDIDLLLQCVVAALGTDSDLNALIEALGTHPAAESAFAIFCRETKQHALLEAYYEQKGDSLQGALCCLHLSEETAQNFHSRVEWLLRGGALAGASSGPLAALVRNSVADAADLLQRQRDLEVKANTSGWASPPHVFVGLSLMQTVRQLILKSEIVEADILREAFRIPDKTFWRCKLQALADGQHFDELVAFAEHRSSPIGLEPFVAACMRKGNTEVSAKLARKIANPQRRAEWLSRLGLEQEAAAALQSSSNSSAKGLLSALSGAFGRR